jgi:hypothetical protein
MRDAAHRKFKYKAELTRMDRIDRIKTELRMKAISIA